MAPVAPFAGDRGLPDQVCGVSDLGDPVASTVRDRPMHSPRPSRARLVQNLPFGFQREAAIELDDRRHGRRAPHRESRAGKGSFKCGRSGGCEHADSPLARTRSSSSVRPDRPSRAILASTSSRRASSCSSGMTEAGADLPAIPTLADVREGFGVRVRVCSRGAGEKMRSVGLKTRPENNRDQRRSNCLKRNAKPAPAKCDAMATGCMPPLVTADKQGRSPPSARSAWG